MYTMDMLQGSGRPMPSRPLRVVVITLALSVLIGTGAWLGLSVRSLDINIHAHQQVIRSQRSQLTALAEADDFMTALNRVRGDLEKHWPEIQQALCYQQQWSGVLTELVRLVPSSVNITHIELDRAEVVVDKQHSRMHWTLIMGLLAKAGSPVVAELIHDLETSERIGQIMEQLRIEKQKIVDYQDRQYQYFTVQGQLQAGTYENEG